MKSKLSWHIFILQEKFKLINLYIFYTKYMLIVYNQVTFVEGLTPYCFRLGLLHDCIEYQRMLVC